MGVCVLGSINLDVVQRVARLPRPGETVLSLGAARFLGGKGANQAVASARAGAATRLFGAVGEDADGADLLARLAAEGVDVGGVARIAGVPTGAAYISVSAQGENQIVVAPGANAAVGEAAVPGDVTVLLAQLEIPVPVVAAAFRQARASGRLTVLNAAPALAEAAGMLELVDVLVVNETELAVLAGLAEAPQDAEGCAAAARGLGPATVIVTRGGAGVLTVTAARAVDQPALKAEVVDTTGAGDCFCGVLAARLSAGAALQEAVAGANAAASISVGRRGAAASMPRWDEVEARLAG